MKTISIMAFASLLVLWGVYTYLRNDLNKSVVRQIHSRQSVSEVDKQNSEQDGLLSQKNLRSLDKIGAVINEKNADIDHETRELIRVEKKIYDTNLTLKEKQVILEQSFMDKHSTIKDTQRLQSQIVEVKNKLKQEISNTEKWDPKFIYYLMIQENFTFQEISQIHSLSEIGINPDEINYINELIKEEAFQERIIAFKNHEPSGRAIASVSKKTREKDEFNDSSNDSVSAENKLIEMNYNQDEKEEMVYGNNQ